jgi:hypothetical protein
VCRIAPFAAFDHRCAAGRPGAQSGLQPAARSQEVSGLTRLASRSFVEIEMLAMANGVTKPLDIGSPPFIVEQGTSACGASRPRSRTASTKCIRTRMRHRIGYEKPPENRMNAGFWTAGCIMGQAQKRFARHLSAHLPARFHHWRSRITRTEK